MDRENISINREKWDGINQYPRVDVEYWNPEKGFGFVVANGKKYYLDSRNIYPSLGENNPKTDKKYELHLAFSEDPGKSGQKPVATCVWGEPRSTSIVVPAKFIYKFKGAPETVQLELSSIQGDGTLSPVSSVYLPPELNIESLEIGAGYEVAVFDGTRAYSSISILGLKKISVEDIKKKRDETKYDLIISAYKNWESVLRIFQEREFRSRRQNSDGEMPQGCNLEYKDNKWSLTLDGDERQAWVDRYNNRLVVNPVLEEYKDIDYGGGVDDFGDVGQAIGAGGFYNGVGRSVVRTRVVKPTLEFDLPHEFERVVVDNSFSHDSLGNITFFDGYEVASDKDGVKIAFWSKKYECWRKFTGKNSDFLKDFKAISGIKLSEGLKNLKHDNAWKNEYFQMLRMAKIQGMNLDEAAPWMKKIEV